MKVNNEVVINMVDGQVISETSYEYSGPVALCKGSSAHPYPKPTEQEVSIQQSQLDLLKQQQADTEMMRPFLLESLGLTEEDGVMRELTQDERYASMSDVEKSQYDISVTEQERAAQAYAGELPLGVGMESNLTAQDEQIRNQLARKLGSNWMTTTAGQSAYAKFTAEAESTREGARTGLIQGTGGLLASNLGHGADASALQSQTYGMFPGRSGGLLQGYGGMGAGLAQNRAREAQYTGMQHMQSQQGSQARNAAFGQMVGMGVQAGMMFSDSRLKENIVTIDNAVNKVNKLRGVEFDWNIKSGLPPGQHDVGVIAQELEEVIPEAVEVIDGYKAVAYHKIIPLLIENIKILHNEINILKEV